MKEYQLVFPFVEEDNKLNGRTCVSCDKQEACVEDGDTIDIDKTCGDWNDNLIAQKKDSDEFMRDFDTLMDKYDVSVDDRRAIYITCQHF